jgi:hypothetical protein
VIVTNPALATLFASTYPDGTKTVTADDEAFALALDLDAASKIVTIDNGTNQIVIDYTNVEYYKPIELTGISVSLDPNSIAGYYTGLCGTDTCPTADVAVDVNGELMQAQMNIASGATQFFVTLDYT